MEVRSFLTSKYIAIANTIAMAKRTSTGYQTIRSRFFMAQAILPVTSVAGK